MRTTRAKKAARQAKAKAIDGAPMRLGKVLDFMRLLWSVDHGLQSLSKQMRTTLEITGPQRLVIRVIGLRPGISAGEVAAALHLHPSTLTGVFRRLEKRRFIARARDPADGRRWLFALTPAGREINALRAGTVEGVVRAALRELEPNRIDAARDVLHALAERLLSATGEE